MASAPKRLTRDAESPLRLSVAESVWLARSFSRDLQRCLHFCPQAPCEPFGFGWNASYLAGTTATLAHCHWRRLITVSGISKIGKVLDPMSALSFMHRFEPALTEGLPGAPPPSRHRGR